ncbi:GNAT family N-acetyltransferase [Candidatus Ruminimicrobium bovinum]|uniref:GNAT family N-acetyltransferase n=1 Tax=Candidatus Ruminimicrobium bovinum TaxID=3242779 RepID=UPI0039B9BEAE
MDKNKLIIKKLLVRDLNYYQIEKLIRDAFSVIVKKGINAVSANITIDKIIAKQVNETFSMFYDNDIVGILIYRIQDNICYVDKLAVSTKYQSLGIGKTLVNELFDECKVLKIKKIWLYTFEYSRNMKFYESLGFIRCDVTHNPNYYFSIIYSKYFNKNKIRDYFLYFRYSLKNFLYKKIIYKTPNKITYIGLILLKLKNFIKKYVFKK